MSSTTSWNYPTAFSHSASSLHTSQRTESAVVLEPKNTVAYNGHLASFVFLFGGLERNLIYDTPIIFDVKQSFLSRSPLDAGTSFAVERAEWRARSDVGLETSTGHKWGKYVALKYARRKEGSSESGYWKQILLEVRALLHEQIRYHPNVVRLLGLCWGTAQGMRTVFPVLVLEYAEFGTLSDLQVNSEPFPFTVKKKLCHDVSKGLSILHACGIIHGN